MQSSSSSGRAKRIKGNSEKVEERPKEVVHVRARRGQATDSHSLAERVSYLQSCEAKQQTAGIRFSILILFYLYLPTVSSSVNWLCSLNQVRRSKINERLRCLQDIVPGCYKVKTYISRNWSWWTLSRNIFLVSWRLHIIFLLFLNLQTMGLAVMLDEIINYVQSLQNQVEVRNRKERKKRHHHLFSKPEIANFKWLTCSYYLYQFLSMKLTAASTFYDFNAESDAIESMQVPT